MGAGEEGGGVVFAIAVEGDAGVRKAQLTKW
jgi:hypothetical protein